MEAEIGKDPRKPQCPMLGVPLHLEMEIQDTSFFLQRTPEYVKTQNVLEHNYNVHAILRPLPKGLEETLKITGFTIFSSHSATLNRCKSSLYRRMLKGNLIFFPK